MVSGYVCNELELEEIELYIVKEVNNGLNYYGVVLERISENGVRVGLFDNELRSLEMMIGEGLNLCVLVWM